MLVLACLLALAGCGDGNDDDTQPFTVTFSKGTARIRCTGGDCAIGVIRDSGLFFVGGTRTVDGVAEEHHLELLTLANVDIRTGSGTDSVLFNDAHVPGTIRISTGAGDDRIDLCDSGAGTAVAIDTGDGADNAQFGSGGYSARFRVELGAGDDYMAVEALHDVAGGVVLDGGDGVDEVNGIFSEVPDGVAIVGFEKSS
jgi:hypothetical protein